VLPDGVSALCPGNASRSRDLAISGTWEATYLPRQQNRDSLRAPYSLYLLFAAIAIVVGAIAAFGDWSALIHPEKQEQFVEPQRHSFERLKQRIGDILSGK
jgi:hypothetical protein